MDGIREGETDGALLARLGTDAAAWAESMVDTARDTAMRRCPDCLSHTEALAQLWDAAPGGWLHGWLANAIEAGRAACYEMAHRSLLASASLQPENLAGSQPENPAGRDQPADLAGRAQTVPSPLARAADALEAIAKELAAQTVVMRHGDRGRRL